MRVLLALAALAVAASASTTIFPAKTTPSPSYPSTYTIVAPSSIRPGIPCGISVNILKAGSDVTVTATIQTSDEKVIGSSSGTFQQDKPGSLQIQIPSSLNTSRSNQYQLHVTGNGGLTFNRTENVGLDTKQLSIFIQTDKAMYKPADTVNFRVLTIHPDLKPYKGPVDIAIQDAGGNKIKQFTGLIGKLGVVNKSLSLSSQPVLGDWKIVVNAKDRSESKAFAIDEYVLPKFEVDVITPSYVVSMDNSVTFTVKAKYTYGKPVTGQLSVAVKLHYSWQDFDTSRDLPIFATTQQIAGENQVTFPMSAALAVSKYINGRKLSVRANVTESLTGNVMAGSGNVEVFSHPFKLEFPDNNPKNFKPGLKYTAYLKVSQQDGVPVPQSKKQVTITGSVTSLLDPTATAPPKQYFWYPQTTSSKLPEMTLTVPADGLVMVPVDIPREAKNVWIRAEYDGVSTSTSVTKMYSPSLSYIQLSLKTTSEIQAGTDIVFDVKATQPLGQMVYQVLARGQIVKIGSIDGHDQKVATFSLPTDSSMAPNARIVVYYVRKDGEIVTDTVSFDVTGVFNNKVAISINQTEAEPGNPVKVTVTADPSSHAHLLAVDQSVLLLKSGNDITVDDVQTELKTYDTKPAPHGPFFGGGGVRPMRGKRSIWWPRIYEGNDAKTVFENSGVIVLTDALVFEHNEPIRPMWRAPQMMAINGMPQPGRQDSPEATTNPLAKPPKVRTNFPESWIWRSMSVGSDGKADLVTSVPDTITSWVATAFAVHPTSGLGVAPTAAKFKVFRPFFVSLNLPYSVVRGENVVVQAIVFNYMSINQHVIVTLAQSNSFKNLNLDAYGNEVESKGDAVQYILVRAGEAKSVYFPIIPAKLGKIDLEVKAQSTYAADALRRQLLVEPEGVPKEFNIPTLIEVQNNQFTKKLNLTLPPNTVSDSELVKVSVVGDLMGPSISGIDNLLHMPTGCGEQTMLGLAPDVYITEYLTSTNQLTGDIKDKALGYMEKGYQRELTYKHSDGSFSAFGNNDKSGSMWLTAFVARVFHQAKSHIFVDDKVLKTAISWMINHQSSNGSFTEPGRVIHKNMQGKAGTGPSLTTFVLISLLENEDLYKDNTTESQQFSSAKQKALSYLETEVMKSDDLYLMAMASYAFQLAGSHNTDQLLAKLDKLANHDGGLYHLHQPETKKASQGSWRSPNPTSAVDTEMTSYVLMTYALRQDLAFGRRILQWITQQRNANGGFSSTQDTVVALNALSMMAEQLYSGNFNLNIDLTLDASTKYHFQVNSHNAAIMQRRETTKVPAEVQVDASGSGTALVEVAVFFNVETEIEDTTFDLHVMLIEETINKLKIQTCTSWLGDGEASGMAVQEIGIPSGFEADLESFTKLETLKRRETQDKKVILYFDEIGKKPVCVTFEAERVGLVTKSQPTAVRVYDYYQPDNQVTGFYQSQILKNSTICDINKEWEKCLKH